MPRDSGIYREGMYVCVCMRVCVRERLCCEIYIENLCV